MSLATAEPGPSLFPDSVTTERARNRTVGTCPEPYGGSPPVRAPVAYLLITSAAGDGVLTARRIRAALWEGAVVITQENDGRFAQALGDLVAVLDDPRFAAFDVVDAAAGVIAAAAGSA
ncbi:hypothetical protein AB0I99_28630 [Streptomyces spongiicola]|uniref:hypothetical protein n=1 Tax=Streptomyces spongiicola TaxID=1690221 RepID=UPI0033DF0490